MKKIIASLLLVCMILGCFTGCGGEDKDGKNTTASGNPSTDNSPGEFVDYVAQTKLDLNSSTAKQKVTVRSYIDGDTTHFEVPSNISSNGVLKARYVCVNTPESTGKIEEWGKKASNFTKEKLRTPTLFTSSPTIATGMPTPPVVVIWCGFGISPRENPTTAA